LPSSRRARLRAVAYLEGQFKAMGLAPGNSDGSYIQNVPLVAIAADPEMTLTSPSAGPYPGGERAPGYSRSFPEPVTIQNCT